ncbi:MAG: hypothetical protein E8D49_04130 [Nitrospira sp.]|nr:MAG: hypothetical protein E8D49_04130 [Nitrospira sp.]
MGPLIKLILLNVITYLILKFVLPNIPGSAPLPMSLVFLYLLLTTAGFLILATVSAESKEEFWGPIQRFLTGEKIGGLQALRYLVLILFPLLVGWQTFNSTAVSDAPPGENRTIHPARLTLPIPRRSRCSRKVISSGGLRRAASAFRSKGCLGNLRCLAGSLNFPTNGSGKSSWVSMMARINHLGPGNSGVRRKW